MKSLDVILLLSRNNQHSDLAINTLHMTRSSSRINKYASIKPESNEIFRSKIEKFDDIKLLINKSTSCFDHMYNLCQSSKADYIMFLHDDDYFGEDLLVNSLSILDKYEPLGLASKATYIDYNSRIYKNRQPNDTNHIRKLGLYKILATYFLPFERPVIFPTVAFKVDELNKYWITYRKRMGVHEDARVVAHFCTMGLFLENLSTSLYYYRIHNEQSSNFKSKEGDRLKLILWLKSLNINIIYKLLLLVSAKLQYLIYIKDIDSKSSFIFRLASKMRLKLINIRRGGDVI